MRAQVIVLGPIERQLSVRLEEDLLPEGTKRAEELAWRIVGCGIEVSERLSRLGLSTAVVTAISRAADDKELVSELRRRRVHLRGMRSETRPIPLSLRVRTPAHDVRIVAPMRDRVPSKEAVVRALPGSRHLHVCGSVLVEKRQIEVAKAGLAKERALGASTSLELDGVPKRADWSGLRTLLRHVDVLFACSDTARALSGESRIGAAATALLELGVHSLAVRLGAGGGRVYSRFAATRIPPFGDERPDASNAFASGYLLGWLLDASAEVCGLLGSAAALDGSRDRLHDRRELSARLTRARQNTQFRKLIPGLSDGQGLLEKSRRLPRRERTTPSASKTS